LQDLSKLTQIGIFGLKIYHLATLHGQAELFLFREWKDGLFSVIMRDQANLTSEGPKWIILDGDIDPMWIESLNTVM
jgi:hypothetical protein